MSRRRYAPPQPGRWGALEWLAATVAVALAVTVGLGLGWLGTL